MTYLSIPWLHQCSFIISTIIQCISDILHHVWNSTRFIYYIWETWCLRQWVVSRFAHTWIKLKSLLKRPNHSFAGMKSILTTNILRYAVNSRYVTAQYHRTLHTARRYERETIVQSWSAPTLNGHTKARPLGRAMVCPLRVRWESDREISRAHYWFCMSLGSAYH